MSPKYLQYCYNSLSLIIIGFVVVVIQIIDGGAGSIWGLNFKQITFGDISFYTIIVSLSLMIQIFLLFIMSRMVFKIRKTSSRSAQIFPYLLCGITDNSSASCCFSPASAIAYGQILHSFLKVDSRTKFYGISGNYWLTCIHVLEVLPFHKK